MLSAADLIQIWETAQTQHTVDRALTILIQDDPTQTRQDFASLSIGERDRRLLQLREETFGDSLNSTVKCPECKEKLEISFTTESLKVPPLSSHCQKEGFKWACDDYSFKFRQPTSLDLASIATCPDEIAAANRLFERCILETRQNGTPKALHELPDGVIRQLREAISESDPQAEIVLDLECPECGHQWQSLFDIVSFFLAEIASRTERLLWEVHALAKAYGWSESEIFALSPLRRHSYLRRIAS